MTTIDTTETETAGWGALDDLPGNPLMWVLIISEILVFGAFFCAFSAARAWHAQAFAADQLELNRLAGGINTMILLTSGFLAANGARMAGLGRKTACRIWLAAAALMGAGFLVVKGFEYSAEFSRGIGMETSPFFTLFYLMTGFHALHVVLGIVILGIVGWKCSHENVETGTAFWHMVDLIWVLLYPIVYLIR
ncbi:MAG TPA: cytochrome c oxidase subunit 3 family protein [Candidatus Sulfotelmatobacter sp.]|jgi:nitric oxide reductase NorE protein|nr:cytochrome c oxidase subunit 3 family protein [Candidatus Sulfotelmatobacter sp.]